VKYTPISHAQKYGEQLKLINIFQTSKLNNWDINFTIFNIKMFGIERFWWGGCDCMLWTWWN
jgi:hypothetical protein